MDVVVVGSCMTDLISYTPRLPKPGETIHGHKFAVEFGGKGANQCVVAARLGAKTAMVAKLGNDAHGKNYMNNFQDNSIDSEHVGITDKASSGLAPSSVDDNGQNAIIIISGANLFLTEEDVQQAENMIKDSKVLLCQLEIQPTTALAALKLGRKHRVMTILNPAPAVPELDPDMYSSCDVFCPNETEAEILTGIKIETVSDAKKAIPVLLERGCRKVIITMGSEGSVFATQEQKDPVHIPTDKVKPINTTGAGDAFIGALGYYLACHPKLELAQAIQRSSSVAAVSVQSPGVQTSFPWRKDLPETLFT